MGPLAGAVDRTRGCAEGALLSLALSGRSLRFRYKIVDPELRQSFKFYVCFSFLKRFLCELR